jgi:hypothetical protein
MAKVRKPRLLKLILLFSCLEGVNPSIQSPYRESLSTPSGSRDGVKLLKARELPRCVDLGCQLERTQKTDADQVQTHIQWLKEL